MIMEHKFCEYGCEQESKYQLRNGKCCCSQSYNSCPAIKKKNSNSIKQLHKNGTLSTNQFDGKRGWAKGLTKETDERVKKYGDSQKGRRFSDEHKEKLCKARRKRIFPTKDTLIEVLMQEGLKKTGIPFKTHVLLLEKYRPDVFIEDNLVIECDGDYWHRLPHIIKIDRSRNQELKTAGYQVLRFWGHEIKNNLEGCLDKIVSALEEA